MPKRLIKPLVDSFYDVYMMIAEPRVRRIIHFFIYACLAIAGTSVFYNPPRQLAGFLAGYFWIWMFGIFIVVGAVLALIAVLPGIWWLERAALISIITGVGLYTITLLFFGASFLITLTPLIIILICTLRLLDIKEFLLAPREG